MNTSSQSSHSAETAPVALATPVVIRWLTLGAIAGPILFTLAWPILGFVSPGYEAWGTWIAPYSPIHQGISGLGMGITAPYMNGAFVLSGLLILAGVVGIFQSMRGMSVRARWICTVLLAFLPLDMAVDGLFTLESFMPHMAGFLLGAGTPVVGFVIIGILLRRIPSFRRFGSWLLLGSPLTLALLVLYFATFSPTIAGTQTGIAGLVERILVIETHAWFVTLGWLAFRHS